MILRRCLHIAAVLLLLPFTGAAAQAVYVSSLRGDDSASGLSASDPVRTIAHARELGSDIRLREGDTFYEYLRGRGFTLRPYREGRSRGSMPVISGFRIIPEAASSRLWQRGSRDSEGAWHPDSGGCIWRLDLMADGFAGYTGNVPENDHRNIHNVGALYDPATDKIYGRKCQCMSREEFETLSEKKTDSPYRYLERDMDFFQVRGDYRYLYVLASDPGMLQDRELWLSMGADGIRGNEFSVTGVKFTGWGKTAVRGGSHIRVTGCSFDIIGGSTHEYEPYWIRFGNGVEFWADQSVDVEVRDCLFSRVFDTATTIQGPMSRDKDSRCSDIHIHHNVIECCRQDFEVWVRSGEGLMPERCSFTRNIGRDCGHNGFDTCEYNNTHLLHYILSPYRVEDIAVEDNEFYGGMGLYYANSAMDNMAIGCNIYHCAQGAPVIRGLYGNLEIDAPVRENGIYRFAEGMTEDGEMIWGYARSRREALRRFCGFINALTGGSGFRLKLGDR